MNPKVFVIVGPTASGKSSFAMTLAEKFPVEIINADSRQVYRGLNIGTSKPLSEDFSKVPHHLYDVCDPNEKFDSHTYQKMAEEKVRTILAKGKYPLVVGGTGLYVKSLLYGLVEAPGADLTLREKLEAEAREKGLVSLHERLKKIDPLAAKRIHQNDPARIIRALEVFELTGKTISEFQANHGFELPRFPFMKIGLKTERSKLYSLINQRVLAMVNQGLESEVKNLLQEWGTISILSRVIGYKEWIDFFANRKTKADVIEEIQQNTRNLAKRQMTWFQKEKDVVWVEENGMINDKEFA